MDDRKRRLWLCLPPVVCCFIDYALTTRYQPASYWAGHLETANELNPVVRAVMERSIVMGHLLPWIWCGLISGLILTTPRWFAVFLSIAVAFGHAHATCSWLQYIHDYNSQSAFMEELGVCTACAALVTLALFRWYR